MSNLTTEGQRLVADVAQRSGFSQDAVLAMLDAVAAGQGSQAQFHHHEFGGMGQWSQGGMIMIGDMFNQGLKFRVDGLCNELSGLLRSQPIWRPVASSSQSQSQGNGGVSLFVAGSGGSSAWWPAELGTAGSTGAQKNLRYACFPASRRLAIDVNGQVRVYDTGDHVVSGFSQSQGGDQSLSFNSQFGLVRVADLPQVQVGYPHPPAEPWGAPAAPAAAFATPQAAPAAPPPAERSTQDLFATLERLAELRDKAILTEDEFAAKKAELLSRL